MDTEGFYRCCATFRTRFRTLGSRASLWRPPRRVRCPLQKRNAILLDRGFAECSVVRWATSTEKKIQAGAKARKFRFVYAPFVQRVDALPTGSGWWCGWSLRPRPLPCKKEGQKTSGRISRGGDHDGADCRFLDWYRDGGRFFGAIRLFGAESSVNVGYECAKQLSTAEVALCTSSFQRRGLLCLRVALTQADQYFTERSLRACQMWGKEEDWMLMCLLIGWWFDYFKSPCSRASQCTLIPVTKRISATEHPRGHFQKATYRQET